MEANEQRQYITDRWEWVQVRLAEPYEGVAEGKWIVRLPLLPFSQIGFDSESEALQAAADFTRQREEEIRKAEEEIAWLKDYIFSHGLAAGSICERILPLEQAALADLRRGWR